MRGYPSDQSVTRTQYDPATISKFKRMSAGAALVMLLLLLRGDRGDRGASVWFNGAALECECDTVYREALSDTYSDNQQARDAQALERGLKNCITVSLISQARALPLRERNSDGHAQTWLLTSELSWARSQHRRLWSLPPTPSSSAA